MSPRDYRSSVWPEYHRLQYSRYSTMIYVQRGSVSCLVTMERLYIQMPITSISMARRGLWAPINPTRRLYTVPVGYEPRRSLKAGNSLYLVVVSSIIACKLAAAAVVLSRSAWVIRIFVCRCSCNWNSPWIAALCCSWVLCSSSAVTWDLARADSRPVRRWKC